MVIKIIEKRDAFDLEMAVNDDLEKTSHKVGDIQYAVVGNEYGYRYSAMIVYEEISSN